MSNTSSKPEGFTYGEYEKWPEGVRCELIDGEVFDMSPGRWTEHQRVLGAMAYQIHDALKGKSCEVYMGPFDVRLPDADEPNALVRTVVQPDICVICDTEKLDEAGCRGAPDFIVEVLCPMTSIKDQTLKASLYERHGVREYWTVHPYDKVLNIRVLDEKSRYAIPTIKPMYGRVEISVLPGVSIDFDEFVTWGPFAVMESGPEVYYPYGGCVPVRRENATVT